MYVSKSGGLSPGHKYWGGWVPCSRKAIVWVQEGDVSPLSRGSWSNSQLKQKLHTMKYTKIVSILHSVFTVRNKFFCNFFISQELVRSCECEAEGSSWVLICSVMDEHNYFEFRLRPSFWPDWNMSYVYNCILVVHELWNINSGTNRMWCSMKSLSTIHMDILAKILGGLSPNLKNIGGAPAPPARPPPPPTPLLHVHTLRLNASRHCNVLATS